MYKMIKNMIYQSSFEKVILDTQVPPRKASNETEEEGTAIKIIRNEFINQNRNKQSIQTQYKHIKLKNTLTSFSQNIKLHELNAINFTNTYQESNVSFRTKSTSTNQLS